jgi:hypothetical protein
MMNLHPRTHLASAAAVALAIAAALGTARGQEPRRLVQPDSIPLELAQALISAGGFQGEPQILVGSLPGWVTSRFYIPASARIVGSAFLGAVMVGVINVPSAPDSLLAEFKRELLSRGWKTPPPPPTYTGGGFRPAPTPVGEGAVTRLSLCGDQQFLAVSMTRRQGTSANVILRVSGSTGLGICNPPQMPASMVRSPWPALYNPAGLSDPRMSGECSATMGGSMGTGTTLRTGMTSEALLEHYGRQLQDSGWVPIGQSASILGRSWSRVDSTGTPTELSLTVTTSARDPTCRDLNLQSRVLRKP